MTGYYAVGDNGTTMFFVTDDSRHRERIDEIRQCKTDEEFDEWTSSEWLACEYDGECYVKIKIEDNYEAMTITEANEFLAEV